MTAPSLSIPVPACAPWCISTEAAHRREHPEDRGCVSEFHAVPLALHKPVDWGASNGDRWGYDKLDMFMRRAADGSLEVLIGHEAGCPRCDSDHEVRMSLDEARALRDRLDELVRLTD